MLFINTIVLKHPLPNVPYQLLTDSSDYALGAILTQVYEDDNQKIVVCASRTLKGPEINYFTSEKEMLAIIWSVEKFETYLFGAKITIKTDHRALTFLKICKFLSPRLMRWALSIQHYDIDIEYIRGKDNIIADLFSRTLYGDQSLSKKIDYDAVVASILARDPSNQIIEKLTNISFWQDQDDEIKNVKRSMVEENKRRRGYKIRDNILFKDEKIVIPKNIIIPLISEIHEIYGHVGNYRCFRIFKEAFAYNKTKRKITQVLKACDSCHVTSILKLVMPLILSR